MVEHKDIMLALLGASAALSGLVLVFLGLVASTTGSYPAGTKPTIIRRKRRPAIGVLVSFGLGIACVGVATWWLVLLHDDHRLYVATVSLFGAQLGSLLGATIWTVKTTMWG